MDLVKTPLLQNFPVLDAVSHCPGIKTMMNVRNADKIECFVLNVMTYQYYMDM